MSETLRQVLGTREWVKLKLIDASRWLHRCPECRTRPDKHWRSIAPRFDSDPVIKMFTEHGVDMSGRCGRCGVELSE